MKRLLPTVLRPVQYRLISTTPLRPISFKAQPAPPPLPKEEQEIFEQLQKQSTGAFSTPRDQHPETTQPADVQVSSTSPDDLAADPTSSTSTADEEAQAQQVSQRPQRKRRTPPLNINQSPHSDPEPGTVSVAAGGATAEQDIPETQSFPQPTVRTGGGQELHPNIRRGAAPEFDGEVNPKTGETGGPKNEPLRWGHDSDWSYNGRVTDF